jgi:hypothetical protein
VTDARYIAIGCCRNCNFSFCVPEIAHLEMTPDCFLSSLVFNSQYSTVVPVAVVVIAISIGCLGCSFKSCLGYGYLYLDFLHLVYILDLAKVCVNMLNKTHCCMQCVLKLCNT